jgi:shikimate dehydrogenase
MAPNFKSELVGSFSTPCAENPTVAMMEAAFVHHGMDWRYINTEVQPDELSAAVAGARAMGWQGFNLSIPHKVSVIEHLDGLGQSASVIGAVNTVVRHGDKLIGENTDGKGFLKALQEVVDPKDKAVVIFGAGGAARAVSVELALAGAHKITIVNRSSDRGQVLVDLLNDKTPTTATLHIWDSIYDLPPDTNIVTNVTSIGLFPDIDARINYNLDTLKSSMVVADAITNPPRTHFIKDAEAQGCKALDGLGMLVNQGVIALKYWTGVDVEPDPMRLCVENVLNN